MILAGLTLTLAYTTMPLRGWTIMVEPAALARPEWSDVKDELDAQLHQITRVVPAIPLEKLRKVRIWVHVTSPGTTCMAYHPGRQWLIEHKMNGDMVKGVEIGDTKNFISWTKQQPWMVLHELAHSYHDQFLNGGFENADVLGEYRRAMSEKLYDSVLHWDGKKTKHYSTTNQMEYFAESSEAFFGTNDFFPFVNSELKTYDPKTFELMKRVWK